MVSISIDEATTSDDIIDLVFALSGKSISSDSEDGEAVFNNEIVRSSDFMKQERFNKYHSETEMMRYIKRLSDKDIALDRSMIPLGSCCLLYTSPSPRD